MSAAQPGAAVAAHGVDLVHEDDAGRVLLGLLEEVADARRADADEHLDEVRAGDREERHARLAGDGTRQQRLAGARRAVEQDALGDARAEGLELLGVLEELLDLVELLHRLVDACDVAERDLGRVDRQALGARLAERHHLGAAALHLVHEEDPEPDEDEERQDVGQQRQPAICLRALDVVLGELVVGHGRLQLRVQAVGRAARVARLVRLPAVELHRDGVVLGLEVDALDRARLQLLHEVAVGRRRLLGTGTDELLGEERQHHHDEDGEGSALEEPAHELLMAPSAPVSTGFSTASRVTARSGPAGGLRRPPYSTNAATYGRLR